MQRYRLYISKTAQRQLDKLHYEVTEKLIAIIRTLADNPRPFGYRKLRGREAYRIRQGNYRIIYEIIDDTLIINVITLGHRKEVYE
jgi:mRNA interferase RelE/StbE